MKLDEFVFETIRQLIEGVSRAQEYTKDKGGDVSPARSDNSGQTEQIRFDVAVTATESSTDKSGMGIFVAGFGAGTQGKQELANQAISRIQFSVQIVYPVPSVDKRKKESASRVLPTNFRAAGTLDE